MGAQTVGLKLQKALAHHALYDALGCGNGMLARANDTFRQTRNRVGGGTALEGNDATIELFGNQARIEVTLLAMANREFRIRREQESRVRLRSAVIRNIAHTALLVGSEDEAYGARQLFRTEKVFCMHRDEMGGMQGNNRRAFVVDDAAAKQVAVFAR